MTKENWKQFWEFTINKRVDHEDGSYSKVTRIGAGWGWLLVAIMFAANAWVWMHD